MFLVVKLNSESGRKDRETKEKPRETDVRVIASFILSPETAIVSLPSLLNAKITTEASISVLRFKLCGSLQHRDSVRDRERERAR